MELTFTPAKPADTDVLIGLMGEYYAFDHIAFNGPLARSALQDLMRDPASGRAWLIKADGQLCGYVVLTFGFSLEFGGRDAFVDELYLRPPYRGQGIGRRALEQMEAECRAEGIQAVHLEVERANTTAQALYHKVGFQDHDRYLLTKWLTQ